MAQNVENQKDSETENKSMFLETVHIEGFRSCYKTATKLRPDLTILLGENNAGKSNLIDAIRLATDPLNGRRTRYFEDEDISIGETSSEAKINLSFKDSTDFQKSFFISGLDLNTNQIHYSTNFHRSGEQFQRGRVDKLAGRVPASDPEPESRGRIKHVYLEPLRDAQRELDSANGRRLGAVLKFLLSKEEQKAFETAAQLQLESLAGEPPVQTARDKIQDHLDTLTKAVRGQEISLGFESSNLDKIARNLRIKMGESGINPVDLASSGLGYANLLFMATVVLELQASKETELTIFLVEEPEAHLHPQLQTVLLDFLQEQAEESIVQTKLGQSAGRIQVIASTHSPNVASAVGIDNIVVVRSIEEAGLSKTVTLSLSDVQFSDGQSTISGRKQHKHGKRKVEQYLDVTRSALLFSRRVILVEGISEAVILPALAKYCVFAGKENRAHYRDFRAASIISVGSVDFEPYLRLLLHDFGNGVRLVDKLTILTDQDPSPAEYQSDEDSSSEPYNRKSVIENNFRCSIKSGVLKVFESPFTLEASLVFDRENALFLKEVYVAQHRNSGPKWDLIINAPNPMGFMHELMNLKPIKQDTETPPKSGDQVTKDSADIAEGKLKYYKNLDLRKGQFAHDFALKLEESVKLNSQEIHFKCPPDLEQAIESVIGDTSV